MAFVSGELLESADPEQLEALYQARPACMTVPTDCSCQQVCGWLAVRPAGHLPAQGDQARIDQLCRRCARLLQKQGNVLQLVTRAGCYAISVDSILLCQSDQKYVLIQLTAAAYTVNLASWTLWPRACRRILCGCTRVTWSILGPLTGWTGPAGSSP